MAEAMPKVVSAQVLAESGRADTLRHVWRAAGFEIGPEVGGTFAITAAPRHFEATFATRLAVDTGGGIRAEGSRKLPLGHLSPVLRDGVTLITFGRPPDFGPGRL